MKRKEREREIGRLPMLTTAKYEVTVGRVRLSETVRFSWVNRIQLREEEGCVAVTTHMKSPTYSTR